VPSQSAWGQRNSKNARAAGCTACDWAPGGSAAASRNIRSRRIRSTPGKALRSVSAAARSRNHRCRCSSYTDPGARDWAGIRTPREDHLSATRMCSAPQRPQPSRVWAARRQRSCYRRISLRRASSYLSAATPMAAHTGMCTAPAVALRDARPVHRAYSSTGLPPCKIKPTPIPIRALLQPANLQVAPRGEAPRRRGTVTYER